MKVEEFAVIQQGETRNVLSHLVESCMRRFLKAARLVNLRGPVIEGLDRARYSGTIILNPLFPAWELICERYRQERFDPQAKLFQDHAEHALERWREFLYWELFPTLLQEDEFVRNVLRVSLLLPCNSTWDAASAIRNHIAGMQIPYGRPAWDSADIE